MAVRLAECWTPRSGCSGCCRCCRPDATWSGAELAERLAVTTRTVRNDVERLRLLGYEVHSQTGIAGGYRLGPGSAMPPLLLDDDEAVAVGLGLSAAAAGTVTGIEETSLRAMTKLEQTLPARLRPRLDALRQATVSAAGGGPTVDADVLVTLATACRDAQQLRFDYAAHAGEEEPPPGRAAPPGLHRAPLVPARLGPRPGGLAYVPRRPRPAAPTHRPPVHPARAARGRGAPRRPRYRLPGVAPSRRGSGCTRRPRSIADRITPAGGPARPVDEHSCVLETGGDSLLDLVAS